MEKLLGVCEHCTNVPVLSICRLFLFYIFNRYKLWYQTTCPQPTQPFLVSVCLQGDLLQIFSGNEQSYMFIGTDASHPLPYTRYQFLLQAENSVAEVNSSFTDTVETAASSMF